MVDDDDDDQAPAPLPDDAPGDAPRQLSMLGEDGAGEDGAGGDGAGELDEPRGPGRPAGSRNRRSVEWTEYVLARYESPLIGMMETGQRSVDEIAKDLNCSRLEAMELKMKAWRDALPYLHQRQPIAVDMTKTNVVYLSIEAPMASSGDAADDESVVIEASLIENDEKSDT